MAAQYRYKKKRDKSEPIIKAALEAYGCTVWPMDTPVDLLVGYRGRNHLVECKTLKSEGGKDKPTELQLKFADNWNGELYYTLHTAEDVTAWIKKIQREAMVQRDNIGSF